MSLRDGSLGDPKPPLAWLALAAFVAAVLVALWLFVSGQQRSVLQEQRWRFQAPAGAVTGALAAPARWLGGGLDGVSAYLAAGSQNRRLRAQVTAARALEDQNAALLEENARLRALLGIRTDPPLPMVGARTILDARGPFSNARLVDVGAEQGIAEGNPVLSAHGLVGRIAGVGPRVSRALLLTDPDSRIPVLIGRTNGRAVLTGDGGAEPRLDYLRTHDPVREGDRVLTSGDGGVIPRGLPVGVLVKAWDGWRVALDADAAPIDFVRILLFRDFSQVAPPPQVQSVPTLATDAPQPKPAPMAAPSSSSAAKPTGTRQAAAKSKSP